MIVFQFIDLHSSCQYYCPLTGEHSAIETINTVSKHFTTVSSFTVLVLNHCVQLAVPIVIALCINLLGLNKQGVCVVLCVWCVCVCMCVCVCVLVCGWFMCVGVCVWGGRVGIYRLLILN